MIPRRPHGNTYWVEPGRLLAGEYPGDTNGDAASTRLGRYLDAGIDYFIDLTEAGELEPYEDRLHAEAAARGKKVEYRRLPIRDVSVPQSPDGMREILDTIEAALSAKRIVYVHCWGGVGRTGTVIGCHLTRHGHAWRRGLDAAARTVCRHGQSGVQAIAGDCGAGALGAHLAGACAPETAALVRSAGQDKNGARES